MSTPRHIDQHTPTSHLSWTSADSSVTPWHCVTSTHLPPQPQSWWVQDTRQLQLQLQLQYPTLRAVSTVMLVPRQGSCFQYWISTHKWGTQFSCLSWSCAEVFAILMPTLGLDGYIYHLGTKFHDRRQEEKYYPISSILLCNFCFPKDAVPTHYVQIWLKDIMFIYNLISNGKEQCGVRAYYIQFVVSTNKQFVSHGDL